MASGRDIRGDATQGRGLAAKMALDDEELYGMSLPGVQFGQPAQNLTPAPPTQSLENAERLRRQTAANEEAAAQEDEAERSEVENWLRLGSQVAGAVGGGLVGGLTTGGPGALPGALYGMGLVGGATEAGVQTTRAASPGAVDRLREERGEDLGGKRTLQAATGAVGALKTGASAVTEFENQSKRADEAALLEASTAAFATGTDEGFAEGEFLMSDSGGRAYLNTEGGDGTYGRDPQYMKELEQYKRLRFPGIGRAD